MHLFPQKRRRKSREEKEEVERDEGWFKFGSKGPDFYLWLLGAL